MSEILMRDLSRARRELGRSHLTGLPARLSLGDLLDTRVGVEVAAYNEDLGPVYVGLVQPADSIRHSDGFRMRRARPIDAGASVTAAREAVAAGMLSFEVGDEKIRNLGRVIELDDHEEIVLLLERPVVADV